MILTGRQLKILSEEVAWSDFSFCKITLATWKNLPVVSCLILGGMVPRLQKGSRHPSVGLGQLSAVIL